MSAAAISRLALVALAAVALAVSGLLPDGGTRAARAGVVPTDCLRLVQTVSVPTMPNGFFAQGEGPVNVAFDPATRTIYAGGPGGVSIEDPGRLVAVDRATGATLWDVDLPGVPFNSLAVSSATNRIYAGSRATGELVVVDGGSQQIVGSVALPEQGLPFGVAVDETSNRVYVTSISRQSGSWIGTISVVDGPTNTIVESVRDVDLAGFYLQPQNLALDAGNDRLYVSADFGSRVLIFEASTLSYLGVLSVGSAHAIDVSVDEAQNRVYVLTYGPREVLVFDASDGSLDATIPVAGNGAVWEMLLDASSNRLYVNRGTEGESGGTGSRIAVIDTLSNTVLEHVPAGIQSFGLTIDPGTGELLVGSGRRGSIDVFDSLPCAGTDTTPPAVAMSTPVDGGVYQIYERVRVDWRCADSGSGLALSFDPMVGTDYCLGPRNPGNALDTMTPGEKTFTVTATDHAGLTTSVTSTYTVVGDPDTTGPEVTVTSPVEGAVYQVGESVLADFQCTDTGGSGIGFCGATMSGGSSVENGQPIDTGSPGQKTFIAYANDVAGNQTETPVTYTVVEAPPRSLTDQPDDIDGAQVHVVYALPSDGVDRFLDVDGTLAESIGSFQAWLSDQTGGRSLRLDTNGGALDVTFFQLSWTDAELREQDPFIRDRIEEDLEAAGFTDPDKLYAVYYDGSSGFSCGGGAWPPTLAGEVAAMYLLGEPPGAPPCSSNVFRFANEYPGYLEFGMLHEIMHTLGFVPECAPNHHRDGHVTGPANDLMYAGDDPWDLANVVLDEDRDDYFGHANAGCLDFEDSPFLTGSPPNPDSDGDGIPDALDGDPGSVSGVFADAAVTFGEILDRAGLNVTVEDLPDPDGVRVSASGAGGQAQVRVCGIAVVRLDPGESVELSCGSVIVTAVQGAAEVVLDNGAILSIPQGTTATADEQADGSYSVTNQGPDAVTLTQDGAPVSVGAGQTVTSPPLNPCAGAPPAGAIVGTPGADRLRGTAGDDVIFALAGNDRVEGRGGNDVVCAGPGNDVVDGGAGNDRLDGAEGSDRLAGGQGDDVVLGGAGDDRLEGGAGNDTLAGGAGNDVLDGARGDDVLDGGPGTDRAAGGAGTDRGLNNERQTGIEG
jgi:hypothetical protein